MSEITAVNNLLTEIEKQKEVLGRERDKMRSLCADLEALLESFDTGIENFEDGLRSFQSALDELSQYV